MVLQPPGMPAMPSLPSGAWTVTARGDSLHRDTITFSAQGAPRAAELWTLRVPEHRASSTQRNPQRVTLRAVRVPALRSPGDAIVAPIVFLAGGPGDAGTRAIGGMPPTMLDSLRARGDVIAFDQRGTRRSDARLSCLTSPLPMQVPLTRGARDSAAAVDAQQCVQQFKNAGVILAGWSTRENAEDLESLRIALNVPRLSLLGGSYGTHLGLAYVGAHETRVARAVLVGVEGPDDTFKLPSRVDAMFARYAAQVDADTSRAGRVPLGAAIDSLRTLLDRTPQVVGLSPTAGTPQVMVDGSTVQRFVADALGDLTALRRLPSEVDRLLRGDLTPLVPTEARRRQARMIDGMNLLMNCTSGASADRQAQIARETASSRLGDVIDAPTPAMCASTATELAPLPPTLPAQVSAAVLFVSGTWDGRTPVANVDALLPRFRNGRHLVIEHQSHGLMGDPTVWDATLQFFAGQDVPSTVVRRPMPALVR
ncbi:MAG TPA: alpha/beta fold hydrolase [Gemmatimonas sp.]|uniref:alpha/beta fold hydrolase n=1 Tax=Gemmatimonas sp. TaxID=1962908 RepID=UPI002EDB7C87